MARIIIWPDIYKEQGHWLPCVTLGNWLKAVGHTVEFMGIPDCEKIVTPYGFTFNKILESVYPPGYSFDEDQLEPQSQRWKPHHLLPIVRGALDGVLTANNGKPAADLLISGYFTSLETLLISYKHRLRFATTTTYLRHPQDTPAMHAKTQLVYMPPALAEKMLTTVAADAPQFWDFDQFVSRFESYPELIPCLRDFDFDDEDWRHDAKNVHYVEPMVTRPAVTALQVTIPTGKSLIYACAGSQVQDYEGRAREFFISLINMMQTTNMGSYHLVLAVGSKLLAELLLKYPKEKQTNFTLCDWVAQPEIMGESNTAAVFVHGGLATIKEAISAGVPMVIVPHGKDQLDNALRVTRKGLGLVAQLEETSALGLRKLLTAVTASSSIANNLSAMRAAFETAEGEVAGKKTAASEKVCVKLIADVLAGDPPTKTS